MSTNDVPGYRAEHQDTLHNGCWAENNDGSLMVVGGLDKSWVRYLIFDTSTAPPRVFADAMHESEFMQTYSGDQWTWHDKTPFPWGNLISRRGGSAKLATVAAARRELTAREFPPDRFQKLIEARDTEGLHVLATQEA